MENKPFVSVIILVKNGLPYIEECLDAVFSQETPWCFEVIVIDSGSTDGTVEIVKKTPAKLIQILPEHFNHGETRNLGASLSNGVYLIFLVADATPVGRDWMMQLVDAANTNGAAGAYSRQLPRGNHNLFARNAVERWHTASSVRRLQKYPPNYKQIDPRDRYLLALYDDVSSCMKKQIWRKYPYHNVHCEDVEWSDRVMRDGYAIVYEPNSVVIHSHQRSIKQDMKRIYVYSKQLNLIFGFNPCPSLARCIRIWLWGIKNGIILVINSKLNFFSKLKMLLYSPVYNLRIFGEYLGPRSTKYCQNHKWYKIVDRWFVKGTQ